MQWYDISWNSKRKVLEKNIKLSIQKEVKNPNYPMKNPYETYVELLKSKWWVTPISVSEEGCIEILRLYFWNPEIWWDDIRTGNFENLYSYDIPEEKKQFDITTTRNFIADISIKPYSGSSIYILKNFDTATIESQNALLKTLEDCPPYARIILLVTHIEDIIETVRSRIISLWNTHEPVMLSVDLTQKIEMYFHKNPEWLIGYLFEWKMSKEEAIEILRISMQYSVWEDFVKYEKGIENIFRVNENPRNILDTIFLIP